MDSLTNSQLAEQYVFNTYPCLNKWIIFVSKVSKSSLKYNAVSCSQLALISQAAMKTIDYITINEQNAKIIRVSKMLNDLHSYAWKLFITFSAYGKITAGTNYLAINSTALQALIDFKNWDAALNIDSGIFDPPTLFNSILDGVTI